MEIPQSLTEAQIAFEAAQARHAAIVQAIAGAVDRGAQAAIRLPSFDNEIEQVHGAILADDALARIGGAAGGARMAAKTRADADKRLASLRAERGELSQTAQAGEEAAHALRTTLGERNAEVVEAARHLVKENRRFADRIEDEFHRDIGRLPLPELFRKWSALGIVRALRRLDQLGIQSLNSRAVAMAAVDASALPNFGNILLRGKYFDLGTMSLIDWKAPSDHDAPVLDLGREIAAIAGVTGQAEKLIARDKAQRERAAEIERQIEQRHRQEAQRANGGPKAVVNYSRGPLPMAHSDLEGWSSPPPEVTGRTIGPRDVDGNLRATK